MNPQTINLEIMNKIKTFPAYLMTSYIHKCVFCCLVVISVRMIKQVVVSFSSWLPISSSNKQKKNSIIHSFMKVVCVPVTNIK